MKHYDAYSQRVGTSTYSGSFSYSGSYLTFTVPFTGTYTIECWGAQGGDCEFSGGRGSYVCGTIHLEVDRTLFVYIGEAGTGFASNQTFNGGGIGRDGRSGSDGRSYRGGGSSDIRTSKHSGSDGWSGSASIESRILVAAGGGGALTYGYSGSGLGGDAGGLIGYSGNTRTKGATSGWTNAAGGGQTSLVNGWKYNNSISNSANGTKGIGGSSITTADPYGSGGGSGYYGGGSGGYVGGIVGSGAGGSSFISGHPGCTTVTGYIFNSGTTKMIDGKGLTWTTSSQVTGGAAEQMPNPSGGKYPLNTGHSGNGYCRITCTTAP